MKSATFRVDAALLQELGERIIGRSYIALAELIKNAYDADATDCRIEFREDEIVVEDNGHGMTEREFHEHWMRIGTTHKSVARESRRLRRPMTGSKGLGRLSVQFLADEMTLESVAGDDPSRHLYALVDWTSVRHGEDLDTVSVLWDTPPGRFVSRTVKKTGTRIVLKKLHEKWNADEIKKLGQDIWVLRSPFERTTSRETSRTALDFYIEVDAPRIEGAEEAFNELQVALFKNWKAKIEGWLQNGRDGGQATIVVKFKEGYPDGLETSKSFRETMALPVSALRATGRLGRSAAALDRARFQVLVFKVTGRQPSGIPVREMRDYLQRFGNVSVYDSGFRLPYYGADHDWLNVATDQGRRLVSSALLPPRLDVAGRYLLDLPAPGRIFGTVDIDTNHEHAAAGGTDATPGTYLQIQVGRDRLADNSAFEQLRDLVRFSLDFYANRYRLLALQTLEKKRAQEAPSRQFRRAATTLQRNRDAIPTIVYREVRGEVVAAEKAAKIAEDAIDRRAVLLAPLATAGMAALALNHELAREIPLLEKAVRRLAAVAAELEDPELGEIAARLSDGATRFRGLQDLFAPLATEEDREATARYRVAALVRTAIRAMEPLMPGAILDADAVPVGLRFPVGSVAEWNAILQNLLSNAWNATLDSDERTISFDGGRRGRGQEWLRVSDTGVGLGVSLDASPSLFEPFERRLQISESNRSIAMGGQGLGLAMVRMIASRRATQAAFVTPRPGFSTSLELKWKGVPR